MIVNYKSLKIIFAGLPFLFSLFSPLSAASEQEAFLGTYLTTLRNLETRGIILAYRYWLTRDEEERLEKGFSIFYPYPICLGFEVRGGYLTRPEDGLECALMINLRYELPIANELCSGFFLGTGGSYSEMKYEKVATHANFINRAGVYFKCYRFLIQSAYEHRSNGHLCSHNRGLDVITASLGYRF